MPLAYELISSAGMQTFADMWLYAAKASVPLIMFVAVAIQLYWCQEEKSEKENEVGLA